LAGSEDYRSVAAHFPARTSSISFSRPATQLAGPWNALRSGELDGVLPVEIDLQTLPDFEAVSKYFTLQGSYVAPVERGVMIVQFSLPGE
jgi:hypothetical protein